MFFEVVERLFTVSLFSYFGQDMLTVEILLLKYFQDCILKEDFLHCRFSALTCIVFHAVLVLFQAICLNVAVNSHNKALLVIMVSNQVRKTYYLIVRPTRND